MQIVILIQGHSVSIASIHYRSQIAYMFASFAVEYFFHDYFHSTYNTSFSATNLVRSKFGAEISLHISGHVTKANIISVYKFIELYNISYIETLG